MGTIQNDRDVNPALVLERKASRGGVHAVRWAWRWLWLMTCFEVAGSDLRFDVFIGYDGILPMGGWFPVVCEVANDGPGFEAVVELEADRFQRGQSWRMSVELPTGTLKRFVVPVHAPSPYQWAWDARLLDERGEVRAELLNLRGRRLHPTHFPLVATMSRAAAEFPSMEWRGGNAQTDWQMMAGRLPADLFPDDPIALEGLEALFLSTERALELRPGQVAAMRDWLFGGGHLIVNVEQRGHLEALPWLTSLLPGEVTGSKRSQSHDALQQWLAGDRDIFGQLIRPVPLGAKPGRVVNSPGNPYALLPTDTAFAAESIPGVTVRTTDGEVLAGTREHPLIVGADRGIGRISLVAFSLELEPFLSWTNKPYFWAKVFHVSPAMLGHVERIPNVRGQSMDGVFASLIETRQVRQLPVGWLMLLLGAYLVVIGPLDRYWLKRINRQMLTWVTFPIYVVLFSLLIYFIGYKLRAGETEWNTLHVVDVLPAEGRALWKGRTFGSIYSPINTRYAFASSSAYAMMRAEFAPSESGPAWVSRRGNNFAASVSVPVWTSRLLVTDWRQDGPAPVSAFWEGEGTERRVTIHNEQSKVCHDVRLIDRDRQYMLGRLEPNQTRTFGLAEARQINLAALWETQHRRFEQALRARSSPFGGDESRHLDDPMDVVVAATVLEQGRDAGYWVPPGMDLSHYLSRDRAVLLWQTENDSSIDALNQFPARRTKRLTVWRAPLSGPAR